MTSANFIELYTDGAAKNNPGRGGYGIVLKFGDKEKRMSDGFQLTTNNRMELLAVIVGLESIKNRDIPVKVFSDSKYVIDSISKQWVFSWVKTGFKKKKNKDLWLRFLKIHPLVKAEFIWVKGHAGNYYNEICDVLAVNAAEGKDLKVDQGYIENKAEESLF